MADEPNPNPQPSPKPDGTSGGDGKNTPGSGAGEPTPALKPEAQTDITQTQEFKQAVTAALEKKIPQLRKQIAKEVSGEKEGQPSVEELQQRTETQLRDLRFYQARDQVEDFIADKRNAANIRNVRAFCRYFKDDFAFDDDGKVTNLKDLHARAKVETPELLGIATSSIDGAAAGNGQNALSNDMNARLRAGR
jgi:hypothetical protein